MNTVKILLDENTRTIYLPEETRETVKKNIVYVSQVVNIDTWRAKSFMETEEDNNVITIPVPNEEITIEDLDINYYGGSEIQLIAQNDLELRDVKSAYEILDKLVYPEDFSYAWITIENEQGKAWLEATFNYTVRFCVPVTESSRSVLVLAYCDIIDTYVHELLKQEVIDPESYGFFSYCMVKTALGL